MSSSSGSHVASSTYWLFHNTFTKGIDLFCNYFTLWFRI